MTSQVAEGTWIRTGGYGRLGGEWVKKDSSWVVAFSTDTFGFIDKCKNACTQSNKRSGSFNIQEKNDFSLLKKAGVQEIVLNFKTSFFPILYEVLAALISPTH